MHLNPILSLAVVNETNSRWSCWNFAYMLLPVLQDQIPKRRRYNKTKKYYLMYSQIKLNHCKIVLGLSIWNKLNHFGKLKPINN